MKTQNQNQTLVVLLFVLSLGVTEDELLFTTLMMIGVRIRAKIAKDKKMIQHIFFLEVLCISFSFFSMSSALNT
jgi:hypothetical protein